jgi:hypothetical protein
MGNKITVKDPHTNIPLVRIGSNTPLASAWIGRLYLLHTERTQTKRDVTKVDSFGGGGWEPNKTTEKV